MPRAATPLCVGRIKAGRSSNSREIRGSVDPILRLKGQLSDLRFGERRRPRHVADVAHGAVATEGDV